MNLENIAVFKHFNYAFLIFIGGPLTNKEGGLLPGKTFLVC